MTDVERVNAAINKFPKTFGLRAFPGEVFRISPGASFVNVANDEVVFYVFRKTNTGWAGFSKGSIVELRRELVVLKED